MKRLKLMTCAALAVGAVAAPAFAVKVGEPLYVRAKNTKLMSKPSATSNAVSVLQPGEKVTWKGPDASAPQWHQVETSGAKKGLVYQSNLGTTPPQMELSAQDRDRAIDAQAFASSGAAIKALSDGAVKYGEAGDMKQAVAELKSLETLAKSVTDAQVSSHVKAAGLGAKGGAR